MKTKFFAILILVLFCLPISVSAHSGRTDSNGGHTDHSTGEYHYHHGYPAHDHWDMDGDGDLDCPYTYTPPKESKPTQQKENESPKSEAIQKNQGKDNRTIIFAATGAAAAIGAGVVIGRKTKK